MENFNKKLVGIIIFIFFLVVCFNFSNALAAKSFEDLSGLKNTGSGIGYEDTSTKQEDIAQKIGTIINAVLAFIGVIFMILILMGAFDIQGAGGNEETVKKGKDKIKNGAIGLAIIFIAYLAANVLLPWLAGGIFEV